LIENGGAGDIGGEEIGSELKAPEFASNTFGERLGQRRLAHSGNVFDQEVAIAKQSKNRARHGFGFANDRSLHLGYDRAGLGGNIVSGQHGLQKLMHRVFDVLSG